MKNNNNNNIDGVKKENCAKGPNVPIENIIYMVREYDRGTILGHNAYIDDIGDIGWVEPRDYADYDYQPIFFKNKYDFNTWKKNNQCKQFFSYKIEYIGDYESASDVIRIEDTYYCQLSKDICISKKEGDKYWTYAYIDNEYDCNYIDMKGIFDTLESKNIKLKNNVYKSGTLREEGKAIVYFNQKKKDDMNANTKYSFDIPYKYNRDEHFRAFWGKDDDIHLEVEYIGYFKGFSDVVAYKYVYNFGRVSVKLIDYVTPISENEVAFLTQHYHSNRYKFLQERWKVINSDDSNFFGIQLRDIYKKFEDMGCSMTQNVFENGSKKICLDDLMMPTECLFLYSWNETNINDAKLLELQGYVPSKNQKQKSRRRF